MLEMLRDLTAHKGHADSAMLAAVQENTGAAADAEVLELLHHILIANRYWLLAILGRPFVLEDESRRPASLEELVQRYSVTHETELGWLATETEANLMRTLESPFIPGGKFSVSQAWMQVCLHSHGHRAQCAKLLRRWGGVPPATDFISWLPGRPRANWVRNQ